MAWPSADSPSLSPVVDAVRRLEWSHRAKVTYKNAPQGKGPSLRSHLTSCRPGESDSWAAKRARSTSVSITASNSREPTGLTQPADQDTSALNEIENHSQYRGSRAANPRRGPRGACGRACGTPLLEPGGGDRRVGALGMGVDHRHAPPRGGRHGCGLGAPTLPAGGATARGATAGDAHLHGASCGGARGPGPAGRDAPPGDVQGPCTPCSPQARAACTGAASGEDACP